MSELPTALASAAELARPPESLGPLFDELPVGLVHLGQDQVPTRVNAPARQFLEGATGTAVAEAFGPICVRAAETGKLAEMTLSLGGVGELRLLATPTSDGFLISLERNGMGRLRTEIAALRALLAAANTPREPGEVVQPALEVLASALPGSSLVLYELAADRAALLPAAHAPSQGVREALLQPAPTLESSPGRALALGHAVHLAEGRRSPFRFDRQLELEPGMALLALPINTGGESQGVLVAVGPSALLGEGELRLLQGLVDLLGSLMQRARHAALLRSERAERERLLEHLPDVVLELDDAGCITATGGQSERLLGRPAADLAGIRLDELLAPAYRAAARERLARVEAGASSLDVELERPGGEHFPCELLIYPDPTAARWGGARAILRDLSLRRALEADLARAREVAVRNERLATVGQLAACITHEINNPLAAAKANISSAQSLVQEVRALPGGEQATDDLAEILADAREGVDRIAGIVRTLKSLVRQRPEERTAFDLEATVRDAVRIFRAARSGGIFEIELPELPHVLGSPGGLCQVLINLFENGVDAMGGTGAIDVSAEVTENEVVLCVRDHGSGIPAGIRERIFEPFFTTKGATTGTGLGLYISRQLLEQMGGQIQFDSTPEGTTFRLRLAQAD